MSKNKSVDYFVFHDKKAAPEDQRVLDRFATNHMYDTLHTVTQARTTIERGFSLLELLRLTELRLHKSGLTTTDNRAKDVEAIQASLLPGLSRVRELYVRHLEETAQMEEQLERQNRDQQRQRAEQVKIKGKKRAVKRKLEPQEEPTIPNVVIAPQDLLASAKARILGPNDEKKIRGAQ